MVGILANLPANEQEALKPLLAVREYREGSKIISFGQRSSSIMFIAEGQARVSRTSRSGKMVVLTECGVGSMFGEIGLLTNQFRTADVIAIQTCTILELSQEDFFDHAKRFGGLTFALCRDLATRLSNSTRQISELAFQDVTERLFNRLLSISVAVDGDSRRVVHERPTQQELADLVGSSREVVSRSLRQLERLGKIEIEDTKTIWIQAPEDER